MISCKNHPEREAAGMCVACGKPFCEDCLVDVNDKYFCKPCIAERMRRIEARRKALEEKRELQQDSPKPQPQPDPEPARVFVENLPQYPAKKKSTALLLWFFFGGLGAHRFYTGHVFTGFVYLCLWLANVWLSWSTILRTFADPSNAYSIITQDVGAGAIVSVAVCLWLFYDLAMILCNVFTDEHGGSLM